MRKRKSYFKDAPLFKLFRDKSNFDRIGPMTWVVVLALVVLFVGLVVEVLKIFILVGGFVLFVYLAFFAAGIWDNLRKR